MDLTRLVDYPDYFISKDGEVYSNKTGNLKKLQPGNHGHGYLLVVLRQNGKPYTRTVHRLMAMTFLDFDPNLDVNHIDGNKLNNKLENLEMCTRSENIKHAYRLGLSNSRGERHSQNKLNTQEVYKIRELLNYKTLTQKQIGQLFGITQTQVGRIGSKKTWAHI